MHGGSAVSTGGVWLDGGNRFKSDDNASKYTEEKLHSVGYDWISSKSHEELRWENYQCSQGIRPRGGNGTKPLSPIAGGVVGYYELTEKLLSISAIHWYQSKSHEEFRWEDYQLNGAMFHQKKRQEESKREDSRCCKGHSWGDFSEIKANQKIRAHEERLSHLETTQRKLCVDLVTFQNEIRMSLAELVASQKKTCQLVNGFITLMKKSEEAVTESPTPTPNATPDAPAPALIKNQLPDHSEMPPLIDLDF